ncbi:MotA/TolQ/ExbB proton channel family protein [Colwellia sp. E2M01]|uniref:MotA/TolQ/ExbB proton channel family protein n=1 Tax=Colwellia sp. E2M01 TaxID=2841561 RepID=UPI001C0823EF|nr:MotA/TolQ/ExbB proton channel family protein [Colwellia sp. E2M01]MBU2871693.1 MotA/TolQ/ExbB proton channel family protein [Colwellia sp. E2M01]
MIEQIANSIICWSIIALALYCYQQLFHQYLMLNQAEANNSSEHSQHEFTSILIGALPLLGLLGTIVGLLECFAGIASQGANSQLMSSGISDALLTTQLGLVCAVPGWLLQSWVRAQVQAKDRLQAENTVINSDNKASNAQNKPTIATTKNDAANTDYSAVEAA